MIRKKITIPLHQKESVSTIPTVPSAEKEICKAGMIVTHGAGDHSFHILKSIKIAESGVYDRIVKTAGKGMKEVLP